MLEDLRMDTPQIVQYIREMIEHRPGLGNLSADTKLSLFDMLNDISKDDRRFNMDSTAADIMIVLEEVLYDIQSFAEFPGNAEDVDDDDVGWDELSINTHTTGDSGYQSTSDIISVLGVDIIQAVVPELDDGVEEEDAHDRLEDIIQIERAPINIFLNWSSDVVENGHSMRISNSDIGVFGSRKRKYFGNEELTNGIIRSASESTLNFSNNHELKNQSLIM